jgi:hypothetical protein
MTAAELLAPQPAPTSAERSRSVTDWMLEEQGMPPELVELLVARREQGRARYGTELETHNGRDPRVDALQEAVDLIVYLGQAVMEQEDGVEAGELAEVDPVLGESFALSGLLLGALAGHLGMRHG